MQRRLVRPLFDSQTGRLLRPAGTPVRQPVLGSPLQRRGFGDFPSESGTPGNPLYPYQESGIFNDGGVGSSIGAQVVSQYPTGTQASGIQTSDPNSPKMNFPNAVNGDSWLNPTTFATIPINSATAQNVPVLQTNFKRNYLLIQNSSTATAVGDTAPTLYIGFNSAAQIPYSLALIPGLGITFDEIVPRDAIYVFFGPFVNTGLSVVIAGCVIQGTYVAA